MRTLTALLQNWIFSDPFLWCPILPHVLFPKGFYLTWKESVGWGKVSQEAAEAGTSWTAAVPPLLARTWQQSLYSWWKRAETRSHAVFDLGCYLPSTFFKTRWAVYCSFWKAISQHKYQYKHYQFLFASKLRRAFFLELFPNENKQPLE